MGRPRGTRRRDPYDAQLAYVLARLGWSELQIGEWLDYSRGVRREFKIPGAMNRFADPERNARKALGGVPLTPRRRADILRRAGRHYIAWGRALLDAAPEAFQRQVEQDIAFRRDVVDVTGRRLTRERRPGRPRGAVQVASKLHAEFPSIRERTPARRSHSKGA